MGRLVPRPSKALLTKPELKSNAEAVEAEKIARTFGATFSSIFYLASGAYYLVFPLIMQDLTLIHLFAVGALSIVTGILLFRMHRAGVWLGLLLFPAQIVIPAFTFLATFNVPGTLQNPFGIGFLVSLAVLMFFASVTFLVLLDQRHNFARSAMLPAEA